MALLNGKGNIIVKERMMPILLSLIKENISSAISNCQCPRMAESAKQCGSTVLLSLVVQFSK